MAPTTVPTKTAPTRGRSPHTEPSDDHRNQLTRVTHPAGPIITSTASQKQRSSAPASVATKTAPIFIYGHFK
jgi:hypothetical protein